MKLSCADGPAKGSVLSSKKHVPEGSLWPVMVLRREAGTREFSVFHTVYKRQGRKLYYEPELTENNERYLASTWYWN